MAFENLQAIVNFAIEKEIEAAEFYDRVSKESSMSGSKEMLKELATEERKHQALLKGLDKKDISEGLESYKFEWIKDIKRSNFVVEMEYEDGMAYNDILLIAMKREEKALELYNKLLDNAQTEDQKKVFKMLCQEEAKHKLAFETMYDDYMAKMGD